MANERGVRRKSAPQDFMSDDTVSLGDLTPDPKNARKHDPRNVGLIADALQEVGAARSIVIDEKGVILAGNATANAAAQAGIASVRVIEASGNELIAVRRVGLSRRQKTRLALFDNRTAELAEWEPDVLSALEPADLDGLFSVEELSAILAGEIGKVEEDDFDAEAAAKAIAEPTSKPGDLYLLGEHRLLCGDSTNSQHVDRLLTGEAPTLMITDPPYGVEYEPAWRNEALGEGNRAVGRVRADDRVDWSEAFSLFKGDVAYVWHASGFAVAVAQSIQAVGFQIRSQIIWAKQHFAISRGHYHWQHEACWYAVRRGATAGWKGDRKQTTLWEINNGLSQRGGRAGASEEATGHSTQKPIECMARAIRNHSGDVYEPFCGSGTTLVAAEQLNRRCYAMEIDAVYCDVIVARWEKLTGRKASLAARSDHSRATN